MRACHLLETAREQLGGRHGQQHRAVALVLALFGQHRLDDTGLLGDIAQAFGAATQGVRHLGRRQLHELLQVAPPLGVRRTVLQFVQRGVQIDGADRPQVLLQLGDVDGQGRHGVAQVVQYPAGVLGRARFERTIDQFAPRLRKPLDHVVEGVGERAQFVAARVGQPAGQIVGRGDALRMVGDARERTEHDAAEQHQQRSEHHRRGEAQQQRRVADGHGAVTGNGARHGDAQG